MIELSRSIPAPPEMTTDLMGFAAGTPLRLAVRMEAVSEGVLVSGTVSGQARGQCGRCLVDFTQEITAQLTELFGYGESPSPVAEDSDEEHYHLVGDLMDIEPIVRDALVTAVPFQPVCRLGCPGLCSECGTQLVADPDHHHDVVDPRWAALQRLGAVGVEPHDPKKEN